MISKANTVEEYLESLSTERQLPMRQLRAAILSKLPQGYQECMTYGMIGYVIPHSLYPKGYHVNPKLPLGLISIASQKNFIAIYHMGLYGDANLLEWFMKEHALRVKRKLDMGKACVRYKHINEIPFDLYAELAGKLTPTQYIEKYESLLAMVAKMKKTKE